MHIYLNFCVCVYIKSVCQSVCQSVSLSINLVFLSVGLSVSLSIYICNVCLSIHLSRLSVTVSHLSVCLSIYYSAYPLLKNLQVKSITRLRGLGEVADVAAADVDFGRVAKEGVSVIT